MSLGEKLLNLRKKLGLSQEEVAEKLNVSRQTVSKWESDQTVPELLKIKRISQLYSVSYDYLISESSISKNITSIEAVADKIDWTSAWSKEYPILSSYEGVKGISQYTEQISKMYDTFKNEFDFGDTDAVLILKDILYKKYKREKNKNK